MKLGIIERICNVCGILKDKDLTESERKDISDNFRDIIEMAGILEEATDEKT